MIVWIVCSLNAVFTRDSLPPSTQACPLINNGANMHIFATFHSDPDQLRQFDANLTAHAFESDLLNSVNVFNTTPTHSHVFYRKYQKTVIHLVMLQKHDTYFLIQKVRLPPFRLNASQLVFGQHDAIYDLFNLEHNLVNDVKMLFPMDRRHFLFQMGYSRFIDCRKDLAAKWRKDYPSSPEVISLIEVQLKAFLSELQVMNQTKDTVDVIKKLMKATSLPIFLDGGSLIGWARHCGEVTSPSDRGQSLNLTPGPLRKRRGLRDVRAVEQLQVRFSSRVDQRHATSMVFHRSVRPSVACVRIAPVQR